MARGENIFKRKDGRWEARYIKGYELSGKIRYGFCYGKSYREAKEKVTKIKAALENGQPTPTAMAKMRFAWFCDEWLKSCRSRVKDSTYIKYSVIVEKHIRPKLGCCHPAEITTALVEQFRDELLYTDELAPKTVRDILGSLKAILRFSGELVPNAFKSVRIVLPKEEKKEMRVLTREEQTRFISYLLTDMDACKFGVLLALCTGIRIGELCALRWEHIYMEEKAIRIAGTMQRLKKLDHSEEEKTHVVTGSPKSPTSCRIIPLMDQLLRFCEQMHPQNDSAYVLTGSVDFMEPRALQYRLKKYTRDCGLEGVHFHSLRHTFATRCVEVGFEIKSLSEILGHSTTTITLDRYVHSSMDLKRSNMNKLAASGI